MLSTHEQPKRLAEVNGKNMAYVEEGSGLPVGRKAGRPFDEIGVENAGAVRLWTRLEFDQFFVGEDIFQPNVGARKSNVRLAVWGQNRQFSIHR